MVDPTGLDSSQYDGSNFTDFDNDWDNSYESDGVYSEDGVLGHEINTAINEGNFLSVEADYPTYNDNSYNDGLNLDFNFLGNGGINDYNSTDITSNNDINQVQQITNNFATDTIGTYQSDMESDCFDPSQKRVDLEWYNKILFSIGGFYKGEDDNYHIKQNWWQQYFGYNGLYDIGFDIVTSMEKEKFPFSMGKNDYIFWAWKGNYLNLGMGAEMGIYYKTFFPGHWGVDKSLALPMTLTLSFNGTQIINYNPTNSPWWVTGFSKSFHYGKAANLTATYTIDFSSRKDMYNAFFDTWSDDRRLRFNSNNHTVTFTF